MNKIRQTLLAVLNSEPTNSTNYKISKYILDNHYVANRVSIDDVAKNCFCAKSTVSRFVRQIGYNNYYALNQDLYLSSVYNLNKYLPYLSDDFTTSKNIFLNDVIHLLQHLSSSIKENEVSELVDDLFAYDKVAIFGNSQSHAMAQLFQNDMCLSKKIINASSLPIHQKQYIQEATKNDLIILISFSGEYLKQFRSRIRYKKDNKPKIVLITCEQKMLQSETYDNVICLEAQDDYAHRAYVISTFLNIVAIEYAKKIRNN